MAGATKRTNVVLGILALLFLVVVIILCLVPRPCKGPQCRIGAQKSMVGDKHDHSYTTLTSPTEVPTTVPSTTEKSTSLSSTDAATLVTSTPEKSTSLSSTDAATLVTSTPEKSTSTAEATAGVQSNTTSLDLSSTTEGSSTLFSTTESSLSSAETTGDQFFGSTSGKSSTVEGSVTPEESVPLSSTTEELTTLTPVTEDLSNFSSTTSYFPTQESPTSSPTTTEDQYFSSSTSGKSASVSSTMTASDTVSDTTEEWMTLFSAVTTDGSTIFSSPAEWSTFPSTTSEGLSSTSEQSTALSSSTETSYLTTDESSTTELPIATTEPFFTADESTTLTSTDEPTVSTSTDETTMLTSTEEDSTIVTETADVCKTTTCKRLASRMLSKMDLGDVEPCQDFYQYSCGGVEDDPFLDPETQQLLAENLIKERLMRVNRNESLLGPVRVFYDSCVNYVKNLNATYRLEQTRNIFSSLGYEFHDKDLVGFDKVNLTHLVAKMMKMHFTPFFDVLLDVDSSNTSQFAFKLVPPLFTSPFSDDLAKATCLKLYQQRLLEARLKKLTVNINSEYDSYTHCMLKGRGLEVRLERMEDAVQSMKLMEHISNEKLLVPTRFNTNFFIESLVQFLPKVPELRMGNLKKNYQEFTLGDLDEMGTVFSSSAIVWKDLMEELLGETVDPSSTVQVYFQKELDSILAELEYEFTDDAKNLQNMLLLMWSERIYTDLVKPVGAAIDSPEHCYRVTTSLMEDFTSYLYLTALPDLPSKEEKIKRMIKQEIAVAQMELHKKFGFETDNAFVKKLQMMSGEVADLDETSEALQANMQGITLNDNFIENSKTLMERYRTLMYSVYKKSPKSHQVMWSQFLLPYSPYGMTSYALNKFLIPYAALEAPLFYDDAPNYINYAGIGHMIAHEIAHGFDGTGVFYNGIEKEKMDGLLAYVGATEHLQEMLFVPWTFNSSSGLMSEFTLYPGLALNEVLADSAANRLAWETYLAEVTSALTTPTEAVPAASGVSRRRRSLDLYPSGSLWSPRQKRQTSYLPSLDSPEPRLPWLELTPAQLYFLRIAQNHCSGSSEINMLTVMENEHLPPRLRVNLVLKNDPLFAEAFSCQVGSGMKPGQQVPFILG